MDKKLNIFDYVGIYILACFIHLVSVGIPFIINSYTLHLDNNMLLLFLVAFSSLIFTAVAVSLPPKEEN